MPTTLRNTGDETLTAAEHEQLAARLIAAARTCLIRAGHHLDEAEAAEAHRRNAATIASLDDTAAVIGGRS